MRKAVLQVGHIVFIPFVYACMLIMLNNRLHKKTKLIEQFGITQTELRGVIMTRKKGKAT